MSSKSRLKKVFLHIFVLKKVTQLNFPKDVERNRRLLERHFLFYFLQTKIHTYIMRLISFAYFLEELWSRDIKGYYIII